MQANENKISEQENQVKEKMTQVKHKLVVISGKGGVGKTSVSVNLAYALSSEGKNVAILDIDVHGPNIAKMLGIEGQALHGFEFGIQPVKVKENLKAVSIALAGYSPDEPIIWRGPMKTAAIRQFIADVDWGRLDYLVVDSPPGTGDEPMTVLKTIPEALSIVVTTPQEISLADVRKAINFLQYAHANILGLVENMSGLICPHCSGRIELFKTGGGEALAKKYGLEFLGAVPLDPAAVVAGDQGKPVVMLDEDTPAKRALLQLADTVIRTSENSLEATAGGPPQ